MPGVALTSLIDCCTQDPANEESFNVLSCLWNDIARQSVFPNTIIRAESRVTVETLTEPKHRRGAVVRGTGMYVDPKNHVYHSDNE